MITKYRTGGFGGNLIQPVEVERETSVSVWINGNRSLKYTDFLKYWDSWEEAHDYLLKKAEREIKNARRQLEIAQSKHGNIKGMKSA